MTSLPNGSPRRSKGARAEREVVACLRENGYPDARRYLAGDGRQPGDIDAIPGVAIDVKNRGRWAPGEWLAQVDEEAGDRLGVVWARLTGETDPLKWPVLMRAGDFLELIRDR